MAKRYKSNEGFYQNADGTRDDATFHEEILDNEEADRATRMMSARGMLERGVDRATVAAVYGEDALPETDATPESEGEGGEPAARD